MLRKVYLEITNVCNLNCAFCPGTVRQKRFMTPEEFRVLAAKIRVHTEYLYLHLMGEPLLHPQLGKLLSIAEELKFKVIITTNGTLLDKKREVLLNSGAVHKLNISLQSFEANEGGKLESYVNQCAAFAKEASEKGKIVSLRLWNYNGLDSLNGEIKSILSAHFPQPWRESRGGLGLGERIWLEPGEKFEWPDMNAPDYGEKCFCYGLRDQLGVLCDGTVVPCCLDREGIMALGSLFESSISEIMLTEKAKKIYDGFTEHKAAEELCRRCGYARRFK